MDCFGVAVTPAERQRSYRQRHGQPVPPLHRRCRCGQTLDGRRPQAVYCSDACRQADRRDRLTRTPASRLRDVGYVLAAGIPADRWLTGPWNGCLADGQRIYWRCPHAHDDSLDATACAETQALTARP